LHDWFTGREITIDYVDSSGAPRRTQFDLAGSQPAILAATDLKSE
jgi:hypothetical protein